MHRSRSRSGTRRWVPRGTSQGPARSAKQLLKICGWLDSSVEDCRDGAADGGFGDVETEHGTVTHNETKTGTTHRKQETCMILYDPVCYVHMENVLCFSSILHPLFSGTPCDSMSKWSEHGWKKCSVSFAVAEKSFSKAPVETVQSAPSHAASNTDFRDDFKTFQNSSLALTIQVPLTQAVCEREECLDNHGYKTYSRSTQHFISQSKGI